MTLKQSHYEILLSEYSNSEAAIALLKHYRPYLEMIPSLRRPTDSVITIPLPVARIRKPLVKMSEGGSQRGRYEAVQLPCDLAILMCDPEWKVKVGVEIMIFIHHPQEDFSDLLQRWRTTQVYLDQDYEWLMPPQQEHIFSDSAEKVHPLFVVFKESQERIQRGLAGAGLPFVLQNPDFSTLEEIPTPLSTESSGDF